ncbi:glutamate ABC transporter substrate-binding protein [Nocardia asteroides NBRC 15531]|uniref:ABC transporter substrate-binding protein n=1 Tax=Nocardia asteroides NBRC 15531 TaxID=1110697 RepID=U5EAG1_NOCAS|nr:glutamate ABC transporter substrate-binding protein [Nocardia asteroides]TLF69424.1 glutamate ABC transporter substrate-binding protein [Nocardia asteroides NBRC 15531]UGT48923.1 glutamate ABC transporter substrate-binding protein [Nocardia asteroides]SFL74803.1 amino acid ABC transporter substrate-binding protein, PAAT family [Nocardia asteroides]VEG31308.1 Glutamine-binding periplasmic protein precursor [Nocardia asteroides]GAD83468.1 putative ABC transporter substrate-binding protein [No
MRRGRAVAALLLAAAALVGGCSDSAPAPDDHTVYSEPPLPAKAIPIGTDTPVPARAGEQCGDPTASLRPSTARGPRIDAIRARGRLVVGLDAGSNLFSFRDPLTGRIVGFDADIAREIARDLLGNPDLIEYRSLASEERERALQDHTVDLIAKTMTITCERRQRVAFSTVYLRADQRVLAVKNSGINGLADLAGKRVCVARGTTSLDHIRRDQPAATILTVPTWADCLVVLQQRQVDAVSTDDAILAGLAAQDPYTEVVGDSISAEPYGIGIPKGDDDLVRFVNATLERIRNDGTWLRIHRRWLATLGETPSPPAPTYQD